MLTCNRCLICYCQTEIISLSAGERASPPPLDKAQTCNDDGANTFKGLQSEDKEEEGPEVLADCLSSPPENKLAKDLRAIFTLKNLLQVPQEELASHLSKWGSPGGWISLCSRCNNAVGNAQRIYQQILDATRILEGMKGDIVGMIKESLDLDNEPSPGNEEIAGILEVTVKTREFVRRCEYDQQSISDPSIFGDLKTNELLKLQQVERVSKSSRNDEEEDLMEAMEVDEEEDVEKSMKSSNILDTSNEAPDDQSIPSIQSPPKLPDSEVQDNAEEISVVLNTEEPVVVENPNIEQPAIPPPEIKPESKPNNTIQLSFKIPKLPVIKKEQVPMPAKVETSWMIDVKPNIFAKKSEEPKKPTAVPKSLESPVPEKLEKVIIPKVKVPDNVEVVVKSEVQTLDVEIIPEVYIPNNAQQTIKLEPPDNLDTAAVKPEALAFGNVEVAIKQEAHTPNPMEEANKPAAQSPENRKEAIKPAAQTTENRKEANKPAAQSPENRKEAIKPAAQTAENRKEANKPAAQSPENQKEAIKPAAQTTENRKEAIKPKTNAPANCFSKLPTTSKSKAIPSPPLTQATYSSHSTMEDMLADLDPFVKELLSVPAPKLPKTKASMSMSASTSSPPPPVKKPIQQAQTAQSHNNSVRHGFDRKFLQGNGTWRHYCRCGISYVNSSSLSRHITKLTKPTVVIPRNAHPDPPRNAHPDLDPPRNAHPDPDPPHKYKCFICKFASPSVLALFNDRSLLEAHLDQVHHTQVVALSASATATKPNEGSSQILNNDGSFKDKSMELKRRLSFIPIQRIALAESESSLYPPPPKIKKIRPSPAPQLQQQQPVQPKNFTSGSPITTTAIKPSRPVPNKPCTPKNVVIRPSPAPKLQSQPVQPKNGTPSSPIVISTNFMKPSRSLLTKPPTPTKRNVKPKWYVCRHCLDGNPPQTKRFTCLAHLTNHIHSAHGGWLCPTPKCEKIFSTWMHLIAHRRKEQCCVKSETPISKPCQLQSQTQVQVLKTSPITVPKLASRPKNTMERYLQISTVERKPIIPRILAVGNDDDDVICIDD